MAETKISVSVDPGKRFQNAIDDAIEKTQDLTIPFIQIAKEWFKGNQAIFSLGGPGKWDDLTEKYKDRKDSKLGFIYPMFRGATGKLEQSLLNPAGEGSVNQIVNKTTLIMGTSVKSKKGFPYPIALQQGWNAGGRKVPPRPFVLIGAEQTGPPEFNARYDAFIAQIESYLDQIALQKAKEK
jgi:hypothetical protein